MSPSEMDSLIGSVLSHETADLDPPSDADWRRLESKFGCTFDEDFKRFIALMSCFQFPGDILNVSSGKTNGNDSIELAFDYESKGDYWKPEMIPFYAIGNGDYFCLHKDECPGSRVFYFYAERAAFEPYLDSFESWIRQLPSFLA
jgi:hypothetical protein